MLENSRVKVSVSAAVCVCVAWTWNLMLVALEVLETIKEPQHMTHRNKEVKCEGYFCCWMGSRGGTGREAGSRHKTRTSSRTDHEVTKLMAICD